MDECRLRQGKRCQTSVPKALRGDPKELMGRDTGLGRCSGMTPKEDSLGDLRRRVGKWLVLEPFCFCWSSG